jgi:RimJ/RimL family protein N-acetyltransferase
MVNYKPQHSRVILTKLKEDDLPVLFEWINNEELVSWNASFKPVSWEAHLSWFHRIHGSDSTILLFAIRLASDNKLIGTCQLRNIHVPSKSAMLQIRIGLPEYHSKGFGTEAVYALLKHGFDDLGLNRIGLHVFSDNERAIRSYLKVGFFKEGILRQAGMVKEVKKDILVMSLLRSEFHTS